MKYIRKPEIIDAIRWDRSIETFKEVAKLYDKDKHWEDCIRGNNIDSPFDFNKTTGTLNIHTGDRIINVNAGYYVIKDIEGNFDVCEPGIFQQQYEELGDDFQFPDIGALHLSYKNGRLEIVRNGIEVITEKKKCGLCEELVDSHRMFRSLCSSCFKRTL